MASFDFHRRRLHATLWLVGSNPSTSRALLNRWAASTGERARLDPAHLQLPAFPLADVAGFDVEVLVEHEPSTWLDTGTADACVLVIGRNAVRARFLERLRRRAQESKSGGPVIWAAEEGWTEALASAARQVGAGDDLLRSAVSNRTGALACLEVALACLIEDLLVRVHPAVPAEWAPAPAIVAQRLRRWTRLLSSRDTSDIWPPLFEEAAAGSKRRREPATDSPWRRQALELERIEPLAAADAQYEIEQLNRIMKFALPLDRRGRTLSDSLEKNTHPARGNRRR